jgi:multiple sugar transport system ATP-binding protein
VRLREALGSEIMVHFDVDARQAVTEHVLELAEDVDEAAVQTLQERPGETTMIGRFGARSRVKEGETIDVAVDTRNLHFFDPDSGSGIYDDTNEKGAS